MNTLDIALSYAQKGIRVIPIKPGHKYPGIEAWQTKATTDVDTIKAWWGGEYATYGIGIATGRTQHGQVFVVDVDDREQYRGSDTLHDLEERYGKLPDTVEAITGTGGRHLYFYAPVEIRNDAGSRLGIGLDIRGEGGQVLAHPTLHPNGKRYEWEDGHSPSDRRPADAPQWLLTLLTSQPAMVTPKDQSDTFLNDPTTPSARYNAQTTWEDLLTKDGWTLAKTDRHGEQHWVRPGKDPRDGTSATIGHNGNDALIVFTSSIPWLPEGGYNRFGYMAARDHNGNWKQAAQTYLATPDGQAEPLPPIPTGDEMLGMLVNWKEFWTQEHTTEDWICKPLIARGRQTAIFAGAKTGKSWLTLNAVAALATGKPIFGQAAQPPVNCLYLDYEMIESDLYERLEQFGYTEDDDLSHFHYAIIPSLPPLNTPEGATALMHLIRLVKAEVVVIDTTGRAIDGEENSADSYREFARTTGLALKREGVACVRTDHAGKNAKLGQRGSSAKNDDVDIVFQLSKTDDGLRLKRTHTRIGWVPETIDLIVEDFDDTINIRLKTKERTGFTTQELDLARKLDQLGFPTEMGVNEIITQAKQLGVKLSRKTTLSRAIQARQMPRPLDGNQFPPKDGNQWEPLPKREPPREPLGNHLLEAFVGIGNPVCNVVTQVVPTPDQDTTQTGTTNPNQNNNHDNIMPNDLW
jgi:hypothetical protein